MPDDVDLPIQVHIPMGRFGEAAEMAKAALFLASDDSSFMTVRPLPAPAFSSSG